MKSCLLLEVVLLSSLCPSQAQTTYPRPSSGRSGSRRRYYWPLPYPIIKYPPFLPFTPVPPAPPPLPQQTCNAATLNNSEADAIRDKLAREGMWKDAPLERSARPGVQGFGCMGRRKRQTQMNGCCVEDCSLQSLTAAKNAFGNEISLYENGGNTQYFHICNCKTAACADGCRCEQGERATLAQTGPQTFSYVWVPCCCRSVSTLGTRGFRPPWRGRVGVAGVTPSTAGDDGVTNPDLPPEGGAAEDPAGGTGDQERGTGPGDEAPGSPTAT